MAMLDDLEQAARIRQVLADIDLKLLDSRKRRQEIGDHPLILAATCSGATAAVIAAVVAVVKLIG